MKQIMKSSAILLAVALCGATSSTRCVAETRADEAKAAKNQTVNSQNVKTENSALAKNKVVINLSTPEKTVRTFVAAINKQDVDAMIACVYGAKPLVGKDGAAFRAMVRKDGARKSSTDSLSIGEIKIFIDVKPIRFETVSYLQAGPERVVAPSVLNMTREDDGWKIIPLTAAQMEAEEAKVHANYTQNENGEEIPIQPQPDVLLLFASQIAQMTQDPRTTLENNLRMLCTSNLRQVALAAMQFSQEWDEKFDFSQGDFVTKLNTFARDEKIFLDPKTNSVFGMNAQLANIELGKIQAPSQTVLFYTGQNGALTFNYLNDTAVVAYADGHVKAVSRAEAAKLRWNP